MIRYISDNVFKMIDISDICQIHDIMSEKCQHYYSEENKICI